MIKIDEVNRGRDIRDVSRSLISVDLDLIKEFVDKPTNFSIVDFSSMTVDAAKRKTKKFDSN